MEIERDKFRKTLWPKRKQKKKNVAVASNGKIGDRILVKVKRVRKSLPDF